MIFEGVVPILETFPELTDSQRDRDSIPSELSLIKRDNI